MGYNIMSNKLLSGLDMLVQTSLLAGCELVSLERGAILATAGRLMDHVYFVETGYLSVLAAETNGPGVEIAVIGREGMAGTWLCLGREAAPFEVIVQGAGTALRMSVDTFKRACDTHPSLQKAVLAYAQDLADMTAETCKASTRLTIESRLARWLVLVDDRQTSRTVSITHEMLARMLGVRRAGVTIALHVLEGEHILRSTRGTVQILDRARLEAAAKGLHRRPVQAPQRELLSPAA